MGAPIQQIYLMEYDSDICAAAQTFLARTSGLNTAHRTAYADLICGLVTDGVWSKLDVFYIFATQDATTAQLNLVSTSYGATPHGSPTFTADRGYTGSFGTTVYIDTGFNAATASSPNYTLNSAHMSVWNRTNTSDLTTIGVIHGSDQAVINIKWIGNDNFYARINSTTGAGNISGIGATNGHWIASRVGASTTNAYTNGFNFFSFSDSSNAVPNANMYCLGANDSGGLQGTAQQHAAISIGGGLSGTDAANLYSRLHTYMVAVGAA